MSNLNRLKIFFTAKGLDTATVQAIKMNLRLISNLNPKKFKISTDRIVKPPVNHLFVTFQSFITQMIMLVDVRERKDGSKLSKMRSR